MVGPGWVGRWVLVGGGLGYGSILEYYYKCTMLYFQLDLVQGKKRVTLNPIQDQLKK